MQSLEHYTDYRQFLKDYYEEKKAQFHYFSYRYFATKAGLSSSSLYRDIVLRKRNLTSTQIPHFIKGLGLKEKEARFFDLLVRFNQAKTGTEKQKYFEELRRAKRRIAQKPIPLDAFGYFSKWYNPVIRELACLLDWKNDYQKLARVIQPPIKAKEAKQSIELLLSLGFLKKNANGKYEQTDPAITTGPEIISPAVRRLNFHMAEKGAEAIERFHPGERDVSSLTMGISEECYKAIKQEIQWFKERVIQLANDDAHSNRVYNLNVQLFPTSTSCDQEEN